MLTLVELLNRTATPGRVEWIGLRPARRAPMLSVTEVRALTNRGLDGDRSAARSSHKRQVTLIQAEHLTVIARLLGRDAAIAPCDLRRNLVVSGINLAALRTSTFRVGNALLEGTGHCHPCSRMEEALGFGGYNAVRGMGGITARILEGETIHVGDAVTLLSAGRGER